jgi:hypothetical protein
VVNTVGGFGFEHGEGVWCDPRFQSSGAISVIGVVESLGCELGLVAE